MPMIRWHRRRHPRRIEMIAWHYPGTLTASIREWLDYHALRAADIGRRSCVAVNKADDSVMALYN